MKPRGAGFGDKLDHFAKTFPGSTARAQVPDAQTAGVRQLITAREASQDSRILERPPLVGGILAPEKHPLALGLPELPAVEDGDGQEHQEDDDQGAAGEHHKCCALSRGGWTFHLHRTHS